MTEHSVDWSPYLGHDWDTPYDGAVSVEKLKALGESITTIPEEHKLQSRVNKLYQDRKAMVAGEKLLDWGMAENLAYATLVDAGEDINIDPRTHWPEFFERLPENIGLTIIKNKADIKKYEPYYSMTLLNLGIIIRY